MSQPPRRLSAHLLRVAGFACACALSASAGAAAPSPAEAVRELQARAAGPVSVVMSPDGSRVVTARGALTAATPGEPHRLAESFLKANAALYGGRPDAGDLRLEGSRTSPSGAHFRYRQTFAGLPVFDAGVDLHLSGPGAVHLLHNRFEPAIAIDTTPAIPAIGAAFRARLAFARAIRAEQGSGATIPAVVVAASELGIASTAGAAFDAGPVAAPAPPRLAWRIVLLSSEPAGAREFLVAADDGAILRARNLAATHHLDGRGRVFDPNPVAYLDDPTLTDQGDADAPEFAPAYLEVVLPNLTRLFGDRFGKLGLRGPYARVTEYIESPFQANPMSSTGDFLFGRDAEGFEAVMCYYHVDRTQRYIQSLGFTDLNNRAIRVDPHGLRGARNAHYLGFPLGAGHIAFGSAGAAGVDLAEDADVIWHEYGHSMQDNQNPGAYLALGEPGAQGEGFGDYWAAINTVVTSPAVADPACIGEWAWEGSCLRRIDGAKHYPEDLEREVHADGEIWSALLGRIAIELGAETANRIILESHYLVPLFPRFSDGVAALLDADQALYGGAHAAAITAAAAERGITPAL